MLFDDRRLVFLFVFCDVSLAALIHVGWVGLHEGLLHVHSFGLSVNFVDEEVLVLVSVADHVDLAGLHFLLKRCF